MDETEVSARLAALPSPPMPEDVLAAIDARLAQERVVVPLTPRHSRRLTWLVAAAGFLALAALIGVGSRTEPVPVAAAPVVRAGAVFEPGGLGQQLQNRMTVAATTDATDTFADSTDKIRACAVSVQAYGRVRFLEVGTYDTTTAVVMVTTYPGNANYEEVWVVPPDCGQDQPTVYRHMLYDVDPSV